MNRPGFIPLFAQESIYTQSDDFGAQLEKKIQAILSDIDSGAISQNIAPHPSIRLIENLVMQRIGMKIHLVTNEALAAILPFYPTKSHIFIKKIFHGNFDIKEQSELLATFDKKKGTVDVQKATLTGIFSQYDHPVFLNIYDLYTKHKLSAAEITAVLLHELGHGFEACYFSDRVDTTNQVLANIARRLMKDAEKADVEYIYREMKSINYSATKEEADKLVHGPRTVAGVTWFRLVVGSVGSLTRDENYNDTAFEQQADAFSSRFGYAKHLILGLDKLHTNAPEKSNAMMVFKHIFDVMVIVGWAFIAAAPLFLATMPPNLIFIGATMAYTLLRVQGDDMQDNTYDALKQRYIRVRQDLVDQLKMLKSEKKEIEALLDNLYLIDAVIKETAVIKTLPKRFTNFVFSGARNAAESFSDQQIMEALASSDLYVKSAEFRVL